MKCQYCGAPLKPNQKFCRNCGRQVTVGGGAPVQPQGGGGKTLLIVLGILGGVALLVILLAVGAFFFVKKKAESVITNNTTATTATLIDQDDQDDQDEEDDNGGDFGDDPQDEYDQEPAVSMNYVDNGYCDIDANQTIDAFERVSSQDGSFYFSYPKYVFNNFEYRGEDNYYFSYEENGQAICYMYVYKEPYSGDRIENGISIQNRLRNQYDSVTYYFPEDIRKHGVGDDGMMNVVVSGYYGSNKTQAEYTLAANDGSDTYYMIFAYPDRDPGNEVENWDYVVNCCYRLCSFSGSQKSPYSDYNAFYKENK